MIAGLTIEHDRGDLYRCALEATAMGVRHNVQAMTDAGAAISRAIAVGGGTQSDLWMQIVSDVSGLAQGVSRVTVGASYGAAFLAGAEVTGAQIDDWNPVVREIEPDERNRAAYDELFELYLGLHQVTRVIQHRLAAPRD